MVYERARRLAETYIAPALERHGLGYGDAMETAVALVPLVASIVSGRADQSDDEIGAFLAKHYGDRK